MKKLNPTFLILFFIMLTLGLQAQNQEVKGVLLDAETKEPIPYASILFGANQGIISNEEGYFQLDLSQGTSIDSLDIQSLGYESLILKLDDKKGDTIYLNPMVFDLAEAFVNSEKLDIDDIMERVWDRLAENYPNDYFESEFFYRQTNLSHVDHFNLKLKESTLEGLDKAFIDSVLSLIPKNTVYYYEMAGNRIGNFSRGKIQIDKAAELYDKEKDLSFEGIGEQMETILKDNVKSNSYLKIKSGLFGTKVELDEVFDDAEDMEAAVDTLKSNEGKFMFSSFQGSVNSLLRDLFFNEDSTLDIYDKEHRYDWELITMTLLGNNNVYKINFEPKGSRDFRGTIYVDVEDYAVLRIEYENVKNLTNFNLFGLEYRETGYKGSVQFSDRFPYRPLYIEHTETQAFGVERPLKFIEKNKHVKGRRKQNELSFKIDLKMLTEYKHELLFISSKDSKKETYQNFESNKEFKPTYLEAFDPEFWSSYLIIEPNSSIQAFKSID